ncbi:MAG: imidazole glycerol phosphate synthase subunit HisH [Actinomycetota bacterium]
MPRVAILDYGMGNLRSVARAVDHAGGDPVVTSDAAEVGRAEALIVPGVGAFGACMANLRATGLDRATTAFAETGRPLVGVCLGMQVLFDHGEEGDAHGLGLLRGEVTRLSGSVKVPHMGWNEVEWTGDHPLVRGIASGTRFYFVHSYACRPAEDVVVGETEHGARFPAVVARDNVFATQFHPEKSGQAGLEVYRNLVKELG